LDSKQEVKPNRALMPFKTILFILFLSNLVFSQGTGCTQHKGENGLTVDLSSLQGVVFNATNIYDSTTRSYYNYEFVACGTIPQSKMGKCKPYSQPISSMCQELKGVSIGSFNLGIFNSTIVTENALVINYEGGDVILGSAGSATLTITCDPKMNTINLISVNSVIGTYHFVANATSKYACSIKCNGHGKYTSSGCSCDLGYSGEYCTYFITIDPCVISLVLNVVEGIIIVALVFIIMLLYRRVKSYSSMSPSSQMNNIRLWII